MRTEEEMNNIYNLYGDSIFKLALSYVKDYATAEDIMQNTLMKYMLNTKVFADKEYEKAWLLRVAINECKMYNRLIWNVKRVSLEDVDLAADEATEDSSVLDAVFSLPTQYRMVIHLYYYEGYSVKEIANILKKKEGTVTSLMCRARKLLKEGLEGEYAGYI